MNRLLRLLLVLANLLGAGGQANAHDAFPMLVTIRQVDGALYSVDLTVPPSVPPYLAPEVRLPESCAMAAGGKGGSLRALYRCPAGLGGAEIGLDYPASVPAVPGMVRMIWQSGETRSVTLAPGTTAAVIPAQESAGGVALQYLELGVAHILMGYDHLLFLVCLLWLAGRFRRILITVTGFTIAHSLTLALSALDIVRVPVPPVEAAIALSIVFLAVEIYKGRRDTLSWRYPIAVSSSFGLLHGLGFAAVLREIGLPQTELFTGLLCFNLGVELGQLVFIAVVIPAYLLVRVIVRRLPATLARPTTMRHASASLVGVLASCWLFDRISGFLA